MHYIRLFPDMSPQDLKGKFDALGLQGQTVELWFNWSAEDEATYMSLVHAAFGVSVTTSCSVEPGLHKALLRFEFTMDAHYFRALAKMVLHHYLLHTGVASGHEEGLSPIKRFIRYGKGDPDEFFTPRRVFVIPEEFLFPRVTSPRWMHLLGYCEQDRQAIGFLRLFEGPRSHGVEYHLRLGRITDRVCLPGAAKVHAYVYDAPVADVGPVGQVEAVPLTRLR